MRYINFWTARSELMAVLQYFSHYELSHTVSLFSSHSQKRTQTALTLFSCFVSLVNVKCVGSSLLQAEKQYTITRRSQQIFGCSERKDICHPQIERNMFREEAIPKKKYVFFLDIFKIA